MSVMTFGPKSLGNIARVLAPGASDYERRQFQSWCKALALFSVANIKAYDIQYRQGRPESSQHEELEPYTAEVIAAAAPSSFGMDPRQAVSDNGLLHYNCVTNNGDDQADLETLQALVGIACGLLYKAPKFPKKIAQTGPEPVSIFGL